MPGAMFFRDLGLFVAQDFLEPSFCIQLRAQLSQNQSNVGTVVSDQSVPVVNESVRKVSCVDLKGPLREKLRERFLNLMPTLENHFKVSLTGCEGPEFLRYGVGEFYLVHTDGRPSGPAKTANRRVSVVLFLNSQSKEPSEDAYCGGSLTFYGLLDGTEWEKIGFPLEAEAGLLIAFRSDVLHEVQPVTFGQRHTVVGWFTTDEDTAPTCL